MTSELLTACLAFGIFGSASLLAPPLWLRLANERVALRRRAARRP